MTLTRSRAHDRQRRQPQPVQPNKLKEDGMHELESGSSTSFVKVTVRNEHLAAQLAEEPGEGFPAVFSTPWLLAQLERAAAKALRPVLEAGQISVGARVSLEHIAPTPVGCEITAHARYVGKEGPLFLFEVWAEDSAGLIGKGSHARAIVAKSAVEKRAEKRCSAELANASALTQESDQ
jgi:fluoroacetyl-CoA thioesterase